MSVSRKTQKQNVIYATPRAERKEENSVFFSPDGEGRIWYNSIAEAEEETGLTKVIHLDSEPVEG